MELQVSSQLFQLLVSLLTGMASGIVYDVFRVMRRRLKASAVLDALFWIVILFALFTLGMDIGGGSLHIFMLAFAALGFGVYMLLFSKFVFAFFSRIADLAAAALSPVKKLAKKVLQVAGILISKAKARVKIEKKPKRKGRNEADEKIEGNNGDSAGGANRICYPEPRRSAKRPQ